jgi:hypothetical protein
MGMGYLVNLEQLGLDLLVEIIDGGVADGDLACTDADQEQDLSACWGADPLG